MDQTDFYINQFLFFLILTLLLLPLKADAESLAVFPLSNAVVRRKGATLNVFCKFSSTTADPKASNEDLTWLFLPLKERRRGSRQPRVKYSDSRTAILRHDGSTSELKIAPLELEDAGHYACASHWNSAVSLGDQIRLDVFVDSGNRSHCDESEFRCSTGECLPSQFRCDRFDNCPDGSDEDGCGDPCFNGFLCRNDRCLDHLLRCDRMHGNNCGDWSDETGCGSEAAASRRTAEEIEEEKVDAELAASRKELADYRLTLYVAIGCVAGLVVIVLMAYCFVQLGYSEEKAAIATVEAMSGGRGGGRGKGRCGGESSSDRFVNMRKLDEIMEGIEKEELVGCLSPSEERRRSWVIVDGEEEEDVHAETPFIANLRDDSDNPKQFIINGDSGNLSYNPKQLDNPNPRQIILAPDSNDDFETPSLSIPPLKINDVSRNVSYNPKRPDSKTRISILTPDSGQTYRDVESPLEDDVFEPSVS